MIKGASRRNPVEGKSAKAVLAVAAASGLVTGATGLHPTGSTIVDFVLVLLATGSCVWAAASAPWWAITAVASAAVALAPNLGMTLLGLVAAVLAVVIGVRRLNWAWVRSLSAGMSVQVLANLEIRALFGVTALVAIAILVTLLVIGAWRRPSKIRKRAIRVLFVTAGFVVLATIGLAVGGISARSSVKTGDDEARRGLSLLASGDVEGARTAFKAAAQAFDSAASNLGKPWTKGAKFVPILAQNSTTAEDLARSAGDATRSIDSILSRLDFESIKLVNGKVDLDAVRALEQPLTELTGVLDSLTSATERADNPWLISTIKDGVNSLARDLAKQRSRGDDALRAVRLAPEMLGANGKRVYFIAFCTPAEARGSLGFMGNFAELSAQDGKLSITRFGRTTDDLNPGADPYNRKITGMAEFLDNYGQYGFDTGENGTAAPDVWQIVTMDRDFPTTAQVIAQLYPQSGGQPIDGVFALDPAALASLLQITGPIAVDGRTEPLTKNNAERYLLLDQYRDASSTADRIDSLESVAHAVTDKLFGGALPEPRQLGKLLGPLARNGHLLAWSAAQDEEGLFRQFHADGALGSLNGFDGFGFALNNASASKIDTFLKSSSEYTYDSSTLRSATISLLNSAPSAGLPDYVIGNSISLPSGTSRLLVSIYSASAIKSLVVDGVDLQFQSRREGDWYLTSVFVQLPPGQASLIRIAFVDANPKLEPPVLVRPALAMDLAMDVVRSP